MDLLEEELLEIGGVSSVGRKGGKGGKGSKKRTLAVRSDSESSGEEEVSDDDGDQISDDDDDLGKTGKSKGGSSMPLKKRAQALAESDEDEDEDSLEAAMRKELGFGEDLYKDAADRKALEGKTEFEREFELSERAEARDEFIQQRQLLQQRRQKERQEAASKTVEQRKRRVQPGRASEAKDSASALKELRALRDRKAQDKKKASAARKKEEEEEEVSEAEPSSEEEEEAKESEGEESEEEREAMSEDEAPRGRREPGRRRRAASEDEYMDEDEDRREREYEREEPEDPEEEQEEEVTLEMLETVRVSRDTLVEWHKESFFQETIIGCFVRVGIGRDKAGRSCYVLAEVLGVKTAHEDGSDLPSYEFPPQSKKFTNKHLRLVHGREEKTMQMTVVSNSPGVESEFHDALRARTDAGVDLPAADIRAVQGKLERASSHRYTAEEVKRLVDEKRNSRVLPLAAARELSHLKLERERALMDGEEMIAEQHAETITQLEGHLSQVSRQEQRVLASINKRNRVMNVKKDYNQGQVNREAKAKKGFSSTNEDPFARRPTTFTSYWTTNSTAQFQAEVQEKQASAKLAVAVEDKDAEKEEEGALPDTPHASADNKVVDVHMSVNLSVDFARVADAAKRKLNIPNVARCRLPPVANSFSIAPAGYKKRLSLFDYKRRQGLL